MHPDVNIEEDFLAFFGKRRDDVLVKIDVDIHKTKQFIYKKIKPHDDETARQMYKVDEYDTMLLDGLPDNYFTNIEKDAGRNFDLEGYGQEMIYRMALDLFPDKSCRILDYGCGSAIFSLNLYFMGFYNITLADIPHRYFRFLHFLCTKYGVNISFIPVEAEVADLKDEEFDYIICSEMLEHVWEPVNVIKYLVNHLKSGGWMYLSTFFNDIGGADPSHLSKNNIYQNDGMWFSIVEQTGLKRKVKDKNNVWKGFQKV